MLFSIPTSFCITVSDAALDPQFGEQFIQLVESGVPRTVAMAGYLAKEYLLRKEQGDAYTGSWGAYLDCLPFEPFKNDQDHILWWSDSEIEELLGGSYGYNDAMATRQSVDLGVATLTEIIGDRPGLEAAIRGAFVGILSRSFYDDGQFVEKEKMIPLLDQLQHDFAPNINYYKNEENIEVRAAGTLDANSELTYCYNYGLSPWNFYNRYGFIPGLSAAKGREVIQSKDPAFFPESEG